eukprot:EG_transcript_3017
MTMALLFKCLITFDDSNVKIRFVGSCVDLPDFFAQLFATAGVDDAQYIPHVWDADFEEFVRLDSFAQLSVDTRKVQLVRKPADPPSPGIAPGLAGDGVLLAEPPQLGPPPALPGPAAPPAALLPQGVVPATPIEVPPPPPPPLTPSPVAATAPLDLVLGSPATAIGVASPVASVALHTDRRSSALQPLAADKGEYSLGLWRQPSSAMKEQEAAANWRSVARPATGVPVGRFAPSKDFFEACMGTSSLFAQPGEITFSKKDKWQEISPQLLADVEDLGFVFSKESLPPLLSSELRAQLAEQGYRLVGTHSAVRLSRWTKTNLRGRGGCFKRTFYGTRSYETVETSPSLSCSSNCVYCWKHPGCPTSSQWLWAVDDAKTVVDNVLLQHIAMLNTMKDVQGVRPDRLLQAQTVRHCDLSLVGEPLLYPHLNSFLQHMHDRKISTWMYHTGMHPKQLEKLVTTTHLTLSVCGPTPQLMKHIMRCSFDDVWERFLASLDIMAKKAHRTALRFVIIKGWTDAYFEEYADIIRRCKPDFIECKGVIFCGKAEPLTLEDNIPTHQDIVEFCQRLCAVPAVAKHYELACEHEHSSCALVAHKKFKINGRWHTWVDVDRFHQLMSQNRPVIRAEDYTAPTPDWALYGSPEQGFDPEETRHRRKRRTKAPPIAGGPAAPLPLAPAVAAPHPALISLGVPEW